MSESFDVEDLLFIIIPFVFSLLIWGGGIFFLIKNNFSLMQRRGHCNRYGNIIIIKCLNLLIMFYLIVYYFLQLYKTDFFTMNS